MEQISSSLEQTGLPGINIQVVSGLVALEVSSKVGEVLSSDLMENPYDGYHPVGLRSSPEYLVGGGYL